jgi:hypothetical protein
MLRYISTPEIVIPKTGVSGHSKFWRMDIPIDDRFNGLYLVKARFAMMRDGVPNQAEIELPFHGNVDTGLHFWIGPAELEVQPELQSLVFRTRYKKHDKDLKLQIKLAVAVLQNPQKGPNRPCNSGQQCSWQHPGKYHVRYWR